MTTPMAEKRYVEVDVTAKPIHNECLVINTFLGSSFEVNKNNTLTLSDIITENEGELLNKFEKLINDNVVDVYTNSAFANSRDFAHAILSLLKEGAN